MPHILIVEDETIIRSALRRLLERNQYQVSEAGSVQEAQERFSIATFDLIVSDLRLPGADDGVTAIARLRQALGSTAPALLVTADAHQADVQQRATAAGLPLLPKPIAPMKLRAFLQSHLPG